MSAVLTQEDRARFEAWVSAPPFEYSIARYAHEERRTAWPGVYRDLIVALAWEAWKAARRQDGAA